MNDKELLEYAAKAAGIEVTGYEPSLGLQYVNGSDDSPFTDYWNPITDDGDALRLAVKLGLDINVYREEVGAVRHHSNGGNYMRHFERTEQDPYAATRRAIVRAAAEIGKDMK